MTPTDPRDRIAEMVGYTPVATIWLSDSGSRLFHPIPSTLDFAAAAWNCLEGWEWKKKFKWDQQRERTIVVWAASDGGRGHEHVPDTHNELTDRLTLLIKVLDWLKANDEPAFNTSIEKIRKVITQ